MAVLRAARAIGICAVIFAVSAISGAVLGIIPGLLLGTLNLHQCGAVMLSGLWAFGFLMQRPVSAGPISALMILVAGGGAVGLGWSVWYCGEMTAS